MKKTLYALSTLLILTFSACNSENEIDESLVANSKNNTPIREEFIEEKFILTTIDNKEIRFKSTEQGLDFKDFKGKKVVLINVWATWCPPCIKEIPILKELQEKYKNDFQHIAVLFEKDKTKEEIIAFSKKHKLNYPITMGEENFRLAKDLGDVKKIPEMFLFTKNGTFIKKFIGETKKETLEKYINIALEETN